MLTTTPGLSLDLLWIVFTGSLLFLMFLTLITHWIPDFISPAVRFVMLTTLLYLPALVLALVGGLPMGTALWAGLVIAALTSLVPAQLHT